MTQTFVIQGEPVSANRYWRHRVAGKRVITYVSPEAKAFRKRVAEEAEGMEPATGPVRLRIVYYHRYPVKRQDTSNVIKVLEDALAGFAFKSDKQVVRVSAEAVFCPDNPRLEVEVSQ